MQPFINFILKIDFPFVFKLIVSTLLSHIEIHIIDLAIPLLVFGFVMMNG